MSIRLIALACFIPSCINAQRPDTANIPRELAVALVMMSDYSARREPTIVVGRVPDQSLARFVPPRARVLGGAIFSGDRGQRTMTIFSLPQSPDSALTVVSSQLESAGLKTPPAFDHMEGRGGFALIGIPGRQGVGYCADSLSAHVTVGEAIGGGALVSLSTTKSLRYTVCDENVRARMRPGGADDEIEMPTLRPPPGATGGRMGMSGSDNSREARAEYQSSLTPVQMLEHFVPQLREQGWTTVNRVSDGDVSIQTAKRTAKDGQPLYLVLTDARFTRTHALTLHVWRESREP